MIKMMLLDVGFVCSDVRLETMWSNSGTLIVVEIIHYDRGK